MSNLDSGWFWSWLLVVLLAHSALTPLAWGHDVEVEGEPESLPGEEHLACDEGTAGMFPCMNMELVEFVPLSEFGGQRTNDIWGWTDPLTGLEYAIVGIRNGTAFFELNDHGHPTFRGTLPTRSLHSSWRDMKVYEDHVFVVSEAKFHGMQVFDLTHLRVQTNGPVIYTSDADYVGFTNAHNIAINEETGFAYAAGTATCNGGLHMIDIRIPQSPQFAGCFATDGYTHDAQCVVYKGPDSNYYGREICFNSNEDMLTIVDVTNKSAPVMLSHTPYFSSGYTHQGWLAEDHAYFFLDDELDERNYGLTTRTFVWDVTDLTAPIITGAHWAQSTAIDHNQYVRGNHIFQANYRAGVRILRIGDLSQAELVEVAYFDTSPADDKPMFAGTWSVYPYFESGFIVASDINKGLFVLRPDLAAVPECSDGIDNDGDGLRDYPEDPTCVSPDHASEKIRLDLTIDFGPSFAQERSEEAPHGLIHLALLGSTSVNVDDIEISSLRLGPLQATPSGPNENAETTGQRYFDDDDFEDRVVKFRIEEIGLDAQDHEVCLEGLIADDPFVACYALCEEEACEHNGGEKNHPGTGPDHKSGGEGPSSPQPGVEPVPALSTWALAALIVSLPLAAGIERRRARAQHA